MNSAYFGSPHLSATLLTQLIEKDDLSISLVVTQPNKPAGKRLEMMPTAVKLLAQKHTIEVFDEESFEKLPRLLEKIDEGYEVVSGWRQGRWAGALFTRRLPSIVANMIISAVTGVSLHDYGCTLKAYRSDVIKGVKLYGEMHRFIPAYAAWQGGRVAEIPVTHSPRKHGKSNYGFGRVFRVLLDLVVVVFMHRYMNRPMHFFGMWGLASLSFGFLVGCIAITLRIFVGLHLIDTPLPVLTALLIIVGIQLVLFGVIGEMIMRTYYESQNRRPYTIKESTIEH